MTAHKLPNETAQIMHSATFGVEVASIAWLSKDPTRHSNRASGAATKSKNFSPLCAYGSVAASITR